MLLLHNIRNNCVPMSLINVHNGKLIQKLSFDQTGKDIEFLEQFNERIMIKIKNEPLKIFNCMLKSIQIIESFTAPEAFIFLYEKEKFLTLKEGQIEIWTSQGELLTDFGKKILCSRMDMSGMDPATAQSNYIVSVSQSKRYLFAYQSEQHQRGSSTVNSGQNIINVIDI